MSQSNYVISSFNNIYDIAYAINVCQPTTIGSSPIFSKFNCNNNGFNFTIIRFDCDDSKCSSCSNQTEFTNDEIEFNCNGFNNYVTLSTSCNDVDIQTSQTSTTSVPTTTFDINPYPLYIATQVCMNNPEYVESVQILDCTTNGLLISREQPCNNLNSINANNTISGCTPLFNDTYIEFISCTIDNELTISTSTNQPIPIISTTTESPITITSTIQSNQTNQTQTEYKSTDYTPTAPIYTSTTIASLTTTSTSTQPTPPIPTSKTPNISTTSTELNPTTTETIQMTTEKSTTMVETTGNVDDDSVNYVIDDFDVFEETITIPYPINQCVSTGFTRGSRRYIYFECHQMKVTDTDDNEIEYFITKQEFTSSCDVSNEVRTSNLTSDDATFNCKGSDYSIELQLDCDSQQIRAIVIIPDLCYYDESSQVYAMFDCTENEIIYSEYSSSNGNCSGSYENQATINYNECNILWPNINSMTAQISNYNFTCFDESIYIPSTSTTNIPQINQTISTTNNISSTYYPTQYPTIYPTNSPTTAPTTSPTNSPKETDVTLAIVLVCIIMFGAIILIGATITIIRKYYKDKEEDDELDGEKQQMNPKPAAKRYTKSLNDIEQQRMLPALNKNLPFGVNSDDDQDDSGL